jgi:peptide/nickel transport system substrate-binding protein
MLVAACAPAAPGQRSDQGSASAPTAPKLLKVGIASDAEPKEFGLAFGSLSAGASEPRFMLHQPMTLYDDQGQLQPRIVDRVPTLENGDWKMLPNGGMELTWKIRPDVRWHDGTPLSAEDLILGYKIAMDPELALGTGVLRQIAELTSPDPQTLVMTWKSIYIYANAMGLDTVVAIPRHKIAALHESGDKMALANSPFWSSEFIGLGPYKMRDWLRGSYIEVEANDAYFLGKPKIDRISLRYYGDTRTLLTVVMAGDVDMVPVGSMKEEEAHVIKTQWESAGAGSVILTNNKLRHGQWQFRDPAAIWAGDPRIRQGLVRMVDRQSLAETVQNGLSSPDDILLPPNDPGYRLAQQRGLPALGFDVNAAHRLLSDAGLVRGGDGTYRTQAGMPFALQISTTGDINSNVQEMLAVSNVWKQGGLEPEDIIITGAMDKDQIRSNIQGINMTSSDLSYRAFEGYVTSEISTQATRWRGANPGGYSNPAYDQMASRLLSTVDSAERDGIAADIIKFLLDQGLYLPLTHSSDVAAVQTGLRGVTGVQPRQRVTAWNAHVWELQ